MALNSVVHPTTTRFSLTPEPGASPVEGFKTGLIQSSGFRMRVAGLTHTQAAAAYLAMMVAYTLGQHRHSAPAGFDRGAQFSRFHFGVPVACKEEAKCVVEFQRVFGAAFALAASADQLDLPAVKAALAQVDVGGPAGSETPFLVFEELAAVVAGYSASAHGRTGPHVVVDVGASTLDVATFHITEGDNAVPVYMTGVELLGAGALAAAQRVGVPDPTFRAACQHHTNRVLSTTFLKKNASFFPNNGIPKPLLLVGGGRLTDVHRELFSHYPKGLEGALHTPAPGKNLRCGSGAKYERLLLAWGLSQEDVRLPRLRRPSVEEAELRGERDYTGKYIDKDMV